MSVSALDLFGFGTALWDWHKSKELTAEEKKMAAYEYQRALLATKAKEEEARQRVMQRGDIGNLAEYTKNLRSAQQSALESLGNREKLDVRNIERQHGRERSDQIASLFGGGTAADPSARKKIMDVRLANRKQNMLDAMGVGEVAGMAPEHEATGKWSTSLKDQFSHAGISGAPNSWAKVGNRRMEKLGLDTSKRANLMANMSNAIHDAGYQTSLGMQKIAREDAREKTMKDAYTKDVTMAETDIDRERRRREDMVARAEGDISAGFNLGEAIIKPIDTTALSKATADAGRAKGLSSIVSAFS